MDQGWFEIDGRCRKVSENREESPQFCERKVSFQPGLLVWCQEATFPNIMQISGTGCSLIRSLQRKLMDRMEQLQDENPDPAASGLVLRILVNFRFQLKIFHPTAPPYLFN